MTLTDVPGILVGHAENSQHQTGCTAVLFPEGRPCGIEVRGFAVGARETELLKPEARVEEVHGILLTGGSAFGLAAADGVVRWLKERGHGLVTPYATIPLVPAAVIYDLNFNRSRLFPDADMGYAAAAAASSERVVQGCVGAGTGATCGKLAGFDRAMKSGLGSAARKVGDVIIGALAVVNPVGYVVDPHTNAMIAGVRKTEAPELADLEGALLSAAQLVPSSSNTVLCLVATNVKMTKLQAVRLARMASAGMARALKPAHMLYDGDVVFAVGAKDGPEADENLVGALAAEVLATAIANGALKATFVPGFPAHRDLMAQ